MTTKKTLLKAVIIFILIFFVAVTWLSMIVPYIGWNNNSQGTWELLTGEETLTEEPLTWQVVTGDSVMETWVQLSGAAE